MGALGIKLYQKTKDPAGVYLAMQAMEQLDGEDPPGWILLDELRSYVVKKLRELKAEF